MANSTTPPCESVCVGNLLTEFGCGAGNITCLCLSPDFGYGVRDCANQTCANEAQYSAVLDYGIRLCSDALRGVPGALTPSTSSGVYPSSPTGGSTATSMPSTSSDSGLSTGAQAGIGVGVAAACVGLAAAGVILWRRRRKQHATVPEPGAASYPELSGEDSRLEKDGKGSAGEMVTEANVHEMQQPPAELSATPEEHGRLTDHRL